MINDRLSLLISAFIVIILGVVLIVPIGNDVELVKIASFAVLNESTGLTGTLNNDELITFDACRNSSMTAVTGIFCNVTLTSGVVSANSANFSDSIVFIDYTYTPDTYVRSSTARTLITLVILFFAIAILAVGIGYVKKSFEDSGMF